MPNWCHNKLIVLGDKQEVDRFVFKNKGEDESGNSYSLLFSKSVPEPDYKEGSQDWHSWRIRNWGTKGEPNCQDSEEIEIETKEVLGKVVSLATYNFETAWGPGLEWLCQTAKKYKPLTFCMTYGEPGMDFGGSVIYREGELIDESEESATEYLDHGMF